MPASSLPPPERRAHIAERQRQATRARILAATLAACVANPQGLPSVEDLVVRARLSRGTFYKYFDTMEAALAALGADLAQLSVQENERFRSVFTDKWKSTAVALRALLTRALLDRTWAALVLRTRGWLAEHDFREIVLQDLAEGRARGEYQVRHDVAVFDMLVGLIESCVAALHRGVPDPEAYIDGVVHTWLQALGVAPERCLQAVDFSRSFLRGYVAGELKPFLDSA